VTTNNTPQTVSFDFMPTTATSTIRITNTSSTDTSFSDGLIDNIIIYEAGAADGSDTIDAGAGDDLLTGGDVNDTLIGGDGADTLDGGMGDDLIQGGADGDRFLLTGDFGADTIVGGETTTTGTDRDILDLSGLTGRFSIYGTGTESGEIRTGADTLSFSEIEVIQGSEYVDFISTQNGLETVEIFGGGGADNVHHYGGDHIIDMGDGDDRLEMRTDATQFGNVTATGGAGWDIVEFDTFDTTLTITDAGATATDGIGTWTLTDFEVYALDWAMVNADVDASATTQGVSIANRDADGTFLLVPSRMITLPLVGRRFSWHVGY
jgi:hypothetical protein